MAGLSQRKLIELSQVSATEQSKIFNSYFSRQSQGCAPVAENSRPELTIFAGFPATGKSTYANALKEKNPNTMVIGVDDFYPNHPHMFELFEASPVKLNSKEFNCYDNELLDNFVDEGFRNTFARALHKNYNILLDCQPTENLLDYAQIGREMGYKVKFVFCAAPKREIETNMILRYEDGWQRYQEAKAGKRECSGSNIPHSIAQMRLNPEYLKEVKKLIRQTVNQGYLTEIVNPRHQQVLFDSRKPGDLPAKTFESEILRDLNPEERRRQEIAIAKINTMMSRRGATVYERGLLTALRRPIPTQTPVRLAQTAKLQMARS